MTYSKHDPVQVWSFGQWVDGTIHDVKRDCFYVVISYRVKTPHGILCVFPRDIRRNTTTEGHHVSTNT